MKRPKSKPANPYAERNAILRAMGFVSYQKYLQSVLWASVRASVLDSSVQCVGCFSSPTQVHHERYTAENLAGRSLEYLTPICAACHHHIEFGRDAAKLAPDRVAFRLAKLRSYKAVGKVDPTRESCPEKSAKNDRRNAGRCCHGMDMSACRNYMALKALFSQVRGGLKEAKRVAKRNGKEAAELQAAQILASIARKVAKQLDQPADVGGRMPETAARPD